MGFLNDKHDNEKESMFPDFRYYQFDEKVFQEKQEQRRKKAEYWASLLGGDGIDIAGVIVKPSKNDNGFIDQYGNFLFGFLPIGSSIEDLKNEVQDWLENCAGD